MIEGTAHQSPKYQFISDAYSNTKTFCGRIVNNVSRNIKSYFVGLLLISPSGASFYRRKSDLPGGMTQAEVRQVVFFNSIDMPPPVPSDVSIPGGRSCRYINSPTVRATLENHIRDALDISFPPIEIANYVDTAKRFIKRINEGFNRFMYSYEIDSFKASPVSTTYSLQAEASKHLSDDDWIKVTNLMDALNKNHDNSTNKEGDELLKETHKELNKIIGQISPNDTPGKIKYLENQASKLYAKSLVKLEKITLSGFHTVVKNSFGESVGLDKKISDSYGHMLDFTIKNLIENHIPSNDAELNNDEKATLDIMLKSYMDRNDFSNPGYMKFGNAKTMRLCFEMIKNAEYFHNLKNEITLPHEFKHQMAELICKIKSTAYRLSNAITEKERLILSAKIKHEYVNTVTENQEIAAKELKILLKMRIIDSGFIQKKELDKYIEETQAYASDILDELSNKNKKSNEEYLQTDEITHQRELIQRNKVKLKELRNEYKQMRSAIYKRIARDVVKEAVHNKKRTYT